ncbi:hypothetical protein DTO166G4_5810 [Paecilomyces variotii]|nr:hypothetical protein DTO032I3_4320 [Paecilomyces variotii]KAJ9212591.1 hypothetical protein DTO166G4_5810 [Paecilomyces variotii]KAJ9230107.1 hypothetical protein DTO166G5_7485 [Paecilomyces variotii]KAJ9231697.1 hypothetical protein DTO169E5_7856 [Paecilomyces variotii]KAJ9250730.1 hypothetical protein DTO207G8_5915 [Paecilomyces variotii]
MYLVQSLKSTDLLAIICYISQRNWPVRSHPRRCARQPAGRFGGSGNPSEQSRTRGLGRRQLLLLSSRTSTEDFLTLLLFPLSRLSVIAYAISRPTDTITERAGGKAQVVHHAFGI